MLIFQRSCAGSVPFDMLDFRHPAYWHTNPVMHIMMGEDSYMKERLQRPEAHVEILKTSKNCEETHLLHGSCCMHQFTAHIHL